MKVNRSSASGTERVTDTYSLMSLGSTDQVNVVRFADHTKLTSVQNRKQYSGSSSRETRGVNFVCGSINLHSPVKVPRLSCTTTHASLNSKPNDYQHTTCYVIRIHY